MTRADLQPIWVQIVDKGYSNYKEFTKEERIWFNIEPLTIDGILDHYINYGADHNEDTIKGLEDIGFKNVADLMRRINSLFPNNIPSKDIDIRQEQMENWDDHEDLLDEIDDQFWEINDDLVLKLESFVIKNFKHLYC